MAIETTDAMASDDGDFVLNGRGGIEIADSTRSTRQVCIFRMKTAGGDYSPNPDIAADIDSNIGSMQASDVSEEIAARISLALTHDQFLAEDDFFVKIIPTSATNIIVVLLVNRRRGFSLEEFSVSFTYDYVTGNIQMLDEL